VQVNLEEDKEMKTEWKEVTQADRDLMDAPFEEDEVEKAIRKAKLDKTPGLDGIPYEFYKTFSKPLSPILAVLFETMVEKQGMGKTQRLAAVKLVEKQESRAFIKDLKGCRPISMLCTDVKLMAMLMATRLQTFLDRVLSPSQTAFIKGRSIQHGRDLINGFARWCEEEDEEGFILHIDWEKAYDRVSHQHIRETLKRANLGDRIISVFETLYGDTASVVMLNGFFTDEIRMRRGVRQGCPLSPLLFAIALEPLCRATENNKDMTSAYPKEAVEPMREAARMHGKMVCHADDCTFLCREAKGVDTSMRLAERFAAASGSKVNIRKTRCVLLGASIKQRDRWAARWRDLCVQTPDEEHTIILGDQIETKNGTGTYFSKAIEKMDRYYRFIHRKQDEHGRTPMENVIIWNTKVMTRAMYIAQSKPLTGKEADQMETIGDNVVWSTRRKALNKERLVWKPERGGANRHLVWEMALAAKWKIARRWYRTAAGYNKPTLDFPFTKYSAEKFRDKVDRMAQNDEDWTPTGGWEREQREKQDWPEDRKQLARHENQQKMSKLKQWTMNAIEQAILVWMAVADDIEIKEFLTDNQREYWDTLMPRIVEPKHRVPTTRESTTSMVYQALLVMQFPQVRMVDPTKEVNWKMTNKPLTDRTIDWKVKHHWLMWRQGVHVTTSQQVRDKKCLGCGRDGPDKMHVMYDCKRVQHILREATLRIGLDDPWHISWDLWNLYYYEGERHKDWRKLVRAIAPLHYLTTEFPKWQPGVTITHWLHRMKQQQRRVMAHNNNE
jgi:hypothetical protein